MSDNLPWLRLYTEAIDDEKLRLLAFEDRWHFIAILCCKGKGILNEDNDQLMWRKVAVKLGLQLRELEEVARRLSEVGLVDIKTLQPSGWDKRQFSSDNSTDRVRRHRNKQKNQYNTEVKHDETLHKRSETVSVTSPDTDTDTDKATNVALSEPAAQVADRADACPHQKIIAVYHQVLPELPGVIVSRWATSQGAANLRTRWREDKRHQAIDFWIKFFSTVRTSKHWMGENERGWQADLRWLLERRNFDKVLTQMVAQKQRENGHG